jgi:nitroreductase
MMIQAQSMGLATHPVSGYKHDVAGSLLGLEQGRNAIAAIVLGKSAEPETLEGPAHEREVAPRVRLALEEITFRR